jgi:hypothetical protein
MGRRGVKRSQAKNLEGVGPGGRDVSMKSVGRCAEHAKTGAIIGTRKQQPGKPAAAAAASSQQLVKYCVGAWG